MKDNMDRVLLQYSGGKDSTACLIKLIDQGVIFQAIHFIHDYSYSIPTEEAIRLSNEYGVHLHIVNITKELEKLLVDNINDRPCRYCKSIMDQISVDFAVKNGFNLICVGDTGSDNTLKERIRKAGYKDYEVSKYFNKKVSLPKEINIYRPLINFSNQQVIQFLKVKGVDVSRVCDTGDRYFQYSREGCPLQFKDFGVYYSTDLMKKLKEANTLCSAFARENNIQASVHLPSGFIVTIPRGYEKDCKNYLESHGFQLPIIETKIKESISIDIDINAYDTLTSPQIIKTIYFRLLERLKEEVKEYTILKGNSIFISDNIILTSILDQDFVFHNKIISKKEINISELESLIVEIFHTFDFKISETKGNNKS
jgi:tRNA(Ile)-lysidine synthase TilS/MesJ